MKNQKKLPSNNYNSKNDNELVALARKKDDRAIEALFMRHHKYATSIALATFAGHPFDPYIENKCHAEQERELMGEIYIAFDKAVADFDFVSAAFKTHLKHTVQWHFRHLNDKKQREEKYCKPMADYGLHHDEQENRDVEPEEYLQNDASKRLHRREVRDHEIRDAFAKAARFFPSSSPEMRALHAIDEAIETDRQNNIVSVAKALGCSRQMVYKIIDKIRKRIPPTLAREILDLL